MRVCVVKRRVRALCVTQCRNHGQRRRRRRGGWQVSVAEAMGPWDDGTDRGRAGGRREPSRPHRRGQRPCSGEALRYRYMVRVLIGGGVAADRCPFAPSSTTKGEGPTPPARKAVGRCATCRVRGIETDRRRTALIWDGAMFRSDGGYGCETLLAEHVAMPCTSGCSGSAQ